LDVDSWLGVLLIVAAALVLLLTAAVSASGVFASRNRARPPAGGKGITRPEYLHEFAQDRARLLSEIVLARTIAIVAATATTLSLVTQRTGIGLRPVLATSAALVVAIGLLEAIPRVVISANPDRWSGRIRPITEAIRAVMLVPAYLLDLPGRLMLRLRPFRPLPREVNEEEEELIRLVELEESQGGIEEEERQMIRAVIELEDTTAREIMVPRIDIVAVETGATLRDLAAVIADKGLSRIPLYEESIDEIVGVVYAKDVLARLASGDEATDPRAIARSPVFVPESKRLDELLKELRSQRIHIAIVVDEYGGTAGLLTIEDLVEEIVGEIEDEYDQAEPVVEQTQDDEVVVDARASVYVLKDLFDVEIEEGDFDTVGGLIIHELGRIPAVNDSVDVDGLRLHVVSLSGRRLRKIRVSRREPTSAPQPGG
jgi:CBS domain containing-hemolysin-like protein